MDNTAPSVSGADTELSNSAQGELSIVIVNFRTGRLVADCLDSLSSTVGKLPGSRVTVVDNASGDDSCAIVLAAISRLPFQGRANLIRSPENLGFAGGNNLAITRELECEPPPRYFLLLNPDTVVPPGAIEAMLEFMSANPSVGVVGPRLQYPDGVAQFSAFHFPSLLSELAEGMLFAPRLITYRVITYPRSDIPQPVDWVPGACLMVRREALEAVGLLEDQFFLYYEEPDFCRRLKQAGWSCWYLPQTAVIHLRGQSARAFQRGQSTLARPQHWHDSRRWYFLKHHGPLSLATADLARLSGMLIWKLRCTLRRRQDLNFWPAFARQVRDSAFVRGWRR